MSKKRNIFVLGMPIPAFFLLLLVFQLFFMPGLLRQEGQLYVPFKKIVVGGSPNSPPYEFLDENNEPAGYLVDLTRAIAAEMKIEVEIQLSDRKSLEEALSRGEIDMLQGVTLANTLTTEYPFYSLTAYSQKLFATQDYPKRISSLDQLHGGTLAVSRHTPYLNSLMDHYPHFEWLPVASHSEALRKLTVGLADFALIIKLPSPYLERELTFLEQNQNGQRIYRIGNIKPTLNYGYLVRNDDSSMIEHINDSLNNLKLSGRQQEIQQQWLGRKASQQTSRREKSVQLGGLIFSPLLLMVCSVFFWNNSLKKEVARRTQEIAMQQAQLIQADKMTSLGILVAGVAHEINNPTGLILHNLASLKRIYEASATILEERYEQEGDFLLGGLPYSVLREDSDEIFSEMQNSAFKINQIVEDLKDFSRQDSLEHTTRTDLNEVVRSAMRLLEGSLRKQPATVRLDLASDLSLFQGNGSRIEQVVVNLVLNAFQASEEYGDEISIRTFLLEKSEEIGLEVVDRGVGIAADELPYLYDPFFTTKRDRGGTGLGLAISDRIVKEHNGRLNFASEPGKGTTVTLVLPVALEEKD